MKKFILFLSIVLLSISCLAQTHISTEAELRTVASNVNGGTTYAGQTIILDNDIELAGNWTPIGKSGKPFKGTFEGNGHKISNLHIANRDTAGLFGYINEGTIQNITVYGNISISGKKRIGGVCGLMQNNSKIENCHFIGQIQVNINNAVDVYVGGIVGEILNGGIVNKCSSTGLIYGKIDKAKCIGGIVGRCGPEGSTSGDYNFTQIENCVNLADICGLSSVGGIIGYIAKNTTVNNCLNCGNIHGGQSGKKFFGGIIGGYLIGMQIYNCLNVATITALNGFPSAVIGMVATSDFSDVCPKRNIHYDIQRTRANTSGYGRLWQTNEIIEGSLNDSLIGWMFDGGYPYPKSFDNDSVKMVAKSYALFSNDEKYDAIETDFTVSNFTGTSWTSRQNKVSVNTPHIVPTDIGKDTLQVRYGSYFKNILINIDENIPLPISLLSFTASPQPEYNLIQWTTATEKNNDLFILERSEDAVVFDEVYNVSGAGNSLEPIDYEFRDYCPVPDITYYRLTQVDYDGSKTTSEMVSCIRTSEKMSNWEYFTHTTEGIQVNSSDNPIEIYCHDILGRLIYTYSLPSHSNTIISLNPPFFVTVYENGVPMATEKVFR